MSFKFKDYFKITQDTASSGELTFYSDGYESGLAIQMARPQWHTNTSGVNTAGGQLQVRPGNDRCTPSPIGTSSPMVKSMELTHGSVILKMCDYISGRVH